MSDRSKIEWTDATWNPSRGCTKVSPGCKNCYAETFAERFRGIKGHPYERGFEPRSVPELLDQPLHWRKPRRIFVCSMSDLFHSDAPFGFIAAVFGVMSACPQHTFQLLTKRPERAQRFFAWLDEQTVHGDTQWTHCVDEAMDLILPDRPNRYSWEWFGDLSGPWPLENVHLGVSVEDRAHGLPRIDVLRRIPAALRFLSIEPLLEGLGEIDLTGIDWVIVGGESGPRARPMHPGWATEIRDQCTRAGVPFFFKQWGRWAPADEPSDGDRWVLGSPASPDHGYQQRWQEGDGGALPGRRDPYGDVVMRPHTRKLDAGRLLDGRTHDELPKRRLPILEAT